ncbi:hypothetical protein ERC79_18655 [Rhodococcus sp. ABRD24]|uniref:hypothetical protein n=1 Tax=Rhodococcus sp. ABRD24 TaxID=2507582 RepID=UPI0010393CDB|nr:hypothetical protein [Rhodococcus sp. ABRD24]QBJ97734.1 hypothetical protein ERC79_18655 [Rhodococcus sp. ABRD24]
MSVVYNILVAAHLLGMAAIVGGYLSVLQAPRISEVIVWGARVQLLTGLAIVGIGEGALDKDYNHIKVGVKLLVTLVVVALAEIGRAREKRSEGNVNIVHAVGVLAIVNALIAALWT